MKIVNINRKNINYWNSWHKEIDKLHTSVKGVYDYIYYTNPPFTIYNSTNRPEAANIDIANSNNCLIYPFTLNGISYNFFLASALRYRQGIENLTENDNGILCYEDEDSNWKIIGKENDNNQTGLYAAGYQLTPLEVEVDTEWGTLYATTEEKFISDEDANNINCEAAGQSIILSRERLSNQKVKLNVNSVMTAAGDTIYPFLNARTILYDKPIQYSTNFPAGYACLSNYQPAGEVDDTSSTSKRNLSSYLIYPLGNGGYYQWNYINSILSANYYENKLGQLSNVSVINLSLMPLRYINYNYTSTQWSSGSYSLAAYGDDVNNVVIGDNSKNIWNGTRLIQPYTTLANNDDYQEEMFTDTKFNFDQTIIINQQIKPLFEAKNTKNTNLSNIRIKFL